MKHSTATDLHSIFRVERCGDALIVTPRGDAAGFGGAEFYREQAAVQGLLKEPGVKSLVVDLGEATYYGSTVIGAINRFGIEVRNAGGRIALCRVSDDTRYILRTMKLDELWEHYPTRGQALAEMATRRNTERFRGAARWAVLAVGVAAVAVVYGVLSGRDIDVGYHGRIMAVYADMQEMKDRGATPSEWAVFARQARRELGPILDDLNETATSRDRAKQYMLFAVRDYLLPLVDRRMADKDGESPPHEYQFSAYMVFARCEIDGSEPPEHYRQRRTPPEEAAGVASAPEAADPESTDPEAPPVEVSTP
jgi:anti-anti-sigma regulatory factor